MEENDARDGRGENGIKRVYEHKGLPRVFSTSKFPYTLQRWNENRNVVLGGGRVGSGFVFIVTRYVASERAHERQAGR